MKIKTKQKLNLPELIQHLMDNEELRGLYYTPTPLRGGVTISESGEVLVEGVYADDTFTVEVEEELTRITEFDFLLEVYFDKKSLIPGSYELDRYSIEEVLDDSSENHETIAIFYRDKLIWSAESGIPEEGVLELDAE